MNNASIRFVSAGKYQSIIKGLLKISTYDLNHVLKLFEVVFLALYFKLFIDNQA